MVINCLILKSICSLFTVVIFLETYKEANQKAQKAMVTSELDSDASLYRTNKRKRNDDGSSSENDSAQDVAITNKKKNSYPRIPLLKKSKGNSRLFINYVICIINLIKTLI